MVTSTGWTAAAVDLSREERGAAHINTKWRKNFKVTIEKKDCVAEMHQMDLEK